MVPKRGQPPKPPEKKRSQFSVYLSPEEKSEVEEARNIKSPTQRTGGFIRDAAVKYSREVVRNANQDK